MKRYYANTGYTTAKQASYRASRLARGARARSWDLANGRPTLAAAGYPIRGDKATGLEAMAAIDRVDAEAQDMRNQAAFLAGRETLARHGYALFRGDEAYWDGRAVIELIDGERRIHTLSVDDVYAASQHGDEAGCLYYYLHRLLRPDAGLRRACGGRGN